MARKIKLTEKETPIMNLLWERGPMFVREVVAAYPEPRPHFNTISTQIRILEDKGFVSHNVVGGAYQYYAIVGREQFIERSFSDIVRSFSITPINPQCRLLSRRKRFRWMNFAR